MSAPDLDALIASPWWEWMPGMLISGSIAVGSGLIATLPRETIQPTRVTSVHNGRPWVTFATGRVGGWGGIDDARPDIDDPATQGCMLALVRKAYGHTCRVSVLIDEDGSTAIYIHDENERMADYEHEHGNPVFGICWAPVCRAAEKQRLIDWTVDDRPGLTPLGRKVAELLRSKPWRIWALPWSAESMADEWGVGYAPRWVARCTSQADAQRIADLFTADDLARAKTYKTAK